QVVGRARAAGRARPAVAHDRRDGALEAAAAVLDGFGDACEARHRMLELEAVDSRLHRPRRAVDAAAQRAYEPRLETRGAVAEIADVTARIADASGERRDPPALRVPPARKRLAERAGAARGARRGGGRAVPDSGCAG